MIDDESSNEYFEISGIHKNGSTHTVMHATISRIRVTWRKGRFSCIQGVFEDIPGGNVFMRTRMFDSGASGYSYAVDNVVFMTSKQKLSLSEVKQHIKSSHNEEYRVAVNLSTKQSLRVIRCDT